MCIPCATMGSMKLAIEQREGYIALLASGNFNVKDAQSGFQQLLDACRSTGNHAAMIDFTELGGTDSATLRVIFAVDAIARYERYRSEGGHRLRVAFVAGESNYLSWQPGMEVAEGMAVATFTELDAAEAWLAQAP